MRPPAAALLADLDEVELVIEKLVAGGDGLGRHEGVPLFVPRSVPGDRVRVRITERRPDYGRGEIVAVLAPGEGRREPPCPYFRECGGCDLQHIEDRRQVELKALAVRETLERLGGVTLPAGRVEIVAGPMWGYRQRTQMQVEAAEDGRPRVGYFARASHDLVAVDRCPILVPELEELLPRLPRRLGDSPPRRLDLLAGSDGAVVAAPPSGDLPHGEVELTVGRETYRLDARCFFQAHRELTATLVEKAVGEEKGAVAVDLFAGVGLFSLPLGRRYERVIAVEGDRIGARFARANARRAGLTGIEVVPQAVESWVRHLPPGADRILVDPPRAGLSRPVVEALSRSPAARLTYVSCHAATLARDLRRLRSVYRLEGLVLLDLFPQSGHMEVVAQLCAA